MGEHIGQVMEQAWSAMEELCAQLGPEDWDLPTDCPGWNVKDQLAHICALESRLLGRPALSSPIQALHVRNEIGAVNEGDIDPRRSHTPEQLLDELRDVTAERGKILASWSDADWNEEGQGVLGKAPRTQIIGIRVVDVFTHEQDIRVATGRPGHMNGEVARFVYGRMVSTLGFVLVKKAHAAEGQTVVFEIGPPGKTFAYGVAGGRGVALDALPTDPTLRLAMDCQTFLRLAAGRWTPQRAEEEGRLRISGDRDLAGRLLIGMNITP